MAYYVMIDDNYHFSDTSARYCIAKFDEAEPAIELCREVVDDFLDGAQQMSASWDPQSLWGNYKMFGEDPFVLATDGSPPVHFSGWDYALQSCIARLAPAPGKDEAAAGNGSGGSGIGP